MKLICNGCKKNLSKAADLLGRKTIKGIHAIYHRHIVEAAKKRTINQARVVIGLPTNEMLKELGVSLVALDKALYEQEAEYEEDENEEDKKSGACYS